MNRIPGVLELFVHDEWQQYLDIDLVFRLRFAVGGVDEGVV